LAFQKEHKLLRIAGIFLPFLWLTGAILPVKPGSPFDIAQRTTNQAAMRPTDAETLSETRAVV